MKPVPLENIRPEVRAIEGYHLKAYDCPVKLNQNESPFDIPEEMKDEILGLVRNQPWSRYPRPMESDLVGALADYTGWTPDGLIVCNGSNTLIQLIIAVTTTPGVAVAVPSPSFSLYALYAGMFGGQVVSVPLTDHFTFDLEGLCHSLEVEKPRTVFLCSPNNPTGCGIRNDDLRSLLAASDSLFVVDEAYGEFSDSTALDLLPEFGNLVVLKTFSKALGAAGIRIGYLLGHPPLVAEILKGKIPFDINVFSHTAAMHILRHGDMIPRRVDALRTERHRVEWALGQMAGVKAYPSDANFILFEANDTKAVFEALVDRGVLVRDVTGYPMLKMALRVTVGRPEENDRFLGALAEVVARPK